MARPVVLASNRGPLSFTERDGALVAKRGAGGLVSGLAPLVAGTDTTWVAAALSDADRTAAERGVIEADDLRVRTVAIAPDVQRQAYDVVSNATLWFIHHGLHDLSRRPVFDAAWHHAWDAYRTFNHAFVAVLADESPADSVVLVQDYHLALVAPALRAARPDLAIVHFSHTPFAPPHLVRVLPDHAAAELIDGMAAADACGFHCTRWEQDFRNSCRDINGAEPTTFVSPLAPDPDDIRAVATSEACEAATRDLDEAFGDMQVIVRVDRIELSKNLLRGFRAFDTLLARRPDLREHAVFLALGYPSREGLPEYLAYRQEVEALASVVNHRWGTATWKPIVLDLRDDFPRSVAALRRYDVLLVNPIRDGLNLVAEEGPIVNERDGMVVLSREAGVWDQLEGAAYGVNPYDIEAQSQALEEALGCRASERVERAGELRRRALARSPRDWLADQLASVSTAD